jgi:hypothetical protein
MLDSQRFLPFDAVESAARPDFDGAGIALDYATALEIPMPARAGIDSAMPGDGVPAAIVLSRQRRDCTSPFRYTL